MDAFAAAVRRTVGRWQMIPEGERLLVAVSGGADSIALLHALWELGHAVVVAHLNHGWRGAESDRDEESVRALAGRLDVPLVVGRWPGEIAMGSSPGGLEQQAREVRYDFLHRSAAEAGCGRIATGHTRDDQAETVLLRLLRGSGLGGLAGILPVRADGVVRPLLEVCRGEVLAYLDRLGVPHVEDTSNLDPRFRRNRVRHRLLPALRVEEPGVERRLAALAAAALSARQRERAFAAELLRGRIDEEGRLRLLDLSDRSPAVRQLAARAWLRRVRGDLRQLSRAHVEAVAACHRSGARVPLPGGASVVNEHGALRFAKRAEELAGEASDERLLRPGDTVAVGARWQVEASAVEGLDGGAFTPPADLLHAVLDADRIAGALHLRTWRFGDRIQPLGMRGSRKLSDVFVDAKVPRWQRTCVPVLEGGGAILWIPGIARAAATAVDASTRRIIRLRAWQAGERPAT